MGLIFRHDSFFNLVNISGSMPAWQLSLIEWVNASVAKHPKTGVTGLLVETEMEKFKCVQ